MTRSDEDLIGNEIVEVPLDPLVMRWIRDNHYDYDVPEAINMLLLKMIKPKRMTYNFKELEVGEKKYYEMLPSPDLDRTQHQATRTRFHNALNMYISRSGRMIRPTDEVFGIWLERLK